MKLRIQVLGPVSATRNGTTIEPVAQNVRHLLGLLAAAGPDGIEREQLANELWQDSPPSSWQSALRNRVTRVRQHIDPDCLIRVGGRLSFSPSVTVDSWDLLDRREDHAEHVSNRLAVLEGDVLASVPASPAVDAHRSAVTESRIALIQELATAGTKLGATALQRVRSLLSRHPHNVALAFAAVEAHQVAGYDTVARELVDSVGVQLGEGKRPEWFQALEQAAAVNIDDHVAAKDDHQALFDAAVKSEDWGLALEVARVGLPEASLMDGDPERLNRLEAIPIDKLNATHRFTLALELTRQLTYIGREEDARRWCRIATDLASTPSEELLVYIVQAVAGESSDERTPIPLPKAIEDAPWQEVSLQSLQVAVMSHLERSPGHQASSLQQRFETLVEARGEPYRRWHLLLLTSMTHFVAGRLTEAAAVAEQAHSYATLFRVANTEIALLGQLANPGYVHPGFAMQSDYAADYPVGASSELGRALQAVADAPHDDGAAVGEFLRTFNHRSRTFFTFPVVVLIAPHVRDSGTRLEILARLQNRSGTSAIWGTGVLHLGPVDRTLAMMQRASEQDVTTHLTNAVTVADQQRTPIWQVTCRLDLAAATGQTEHLSEARRFVTTDELQKLVDDYESPFG